LPRLFRAAANIAPLALALACASLPAPPPSRDQGYRYVDRRLGIALELPPGWQGYPHRRDLPPNLAAAMPRGPYPRLVGMDPSGTALLRVFVEPAPEMTARAFVESLIETSGEPVEILTAAYAEPRDTVRWRFRTKGALQVTFVETVAVRNGRAIRVAFWVPSRLFTAFVDEFDRIADGILLYGEAGWEAPWRDLGAALDAAAFPELELGKDDDEPVPSCQGEPHGMLWVVESGSGKAFLFPSIHVGHPHQYPLPAAIEEAFAESSRLVVEVNVRASDNATLLARAARRRSGAEPTPEQRARAETWLAARGMPFTPFAAQPAWVLAVTLEFLQWQLEGFLPQYGVEMHFLERAGAREVVELESPEEQLAVLQRLGPAGLDHTLASLDGMSEQIRATYAAWYCGDDDSIARAVAQAEAAPAELEEVMLTSRNEIMVERLVPLLDDPGVTFVTVGLGHFLDPRGLPALLEQRGYAVRRR
jgi:uncharacterized protein YbaP (TraB family)